MPEPDLPEKLGIGAGAKVALLHAPGGIEDLFSPMPEGAELRHGLRKSERVDVIVGFVSERDHLARNIGWLVSTLDAGGAFWVAWPAGAHAATDLSDAAVREVARSVGWVATVNCDVDGSWTALRLVAGPTARPS